MLLRFILYVPKPNCARFTFFFPLGNNTMIEQLSPIQEHYLKRELVRAQISYEVQHLLDFKSITSLGPPFADSNGEYHDGYRELPIMTHIFNAQVQTFPFINSVNQKEFWQDKVQTFVQSLAQKGLSSSADRSEETKRRRIGRKLTNLIALYMGSGLQTTTPMEKTARVQPPAEKGVRNIDLEKIVLDLYDAHYINDIDVNVVGVRIVSERHGFLYEDHAEFIIKAQFRGAPPVHVARRYSEFRKLQTQLEKEFPGKQLPSLPSHNKTATILSDSEESDSISLASEESDHENESVNRATPLKKFFYGNKKQASTYPREKQRITLRSYLRALLRNSQVVKSQSLLEFFFRDRFKPSLEELKDMDDRRRLDIKRIEDQIEFYKIATERARILEVHMSQFKQDLMAPGGLQNIFSEIREKESIDQLSPKFQKFLEWAEIEVGGTLYNMFVADDSSPELFSQVSRIHKLVPYTLLRAVLRVSNPMAIMKGVIDLFLAQPLGRRSLLQNILIMVLADDIKTQEKAISEMKKKINNPSIVASFEAYINASYSVKEEIRARDSALIVSIVNSPMISQVPPEAVMEIEVWYAEWNRAVEGERIENSEFVDCFSNLTELFKLMVRKRDKDQIQNLWDEASTMGLVKNLFTIFYGPLVEVFRSAKVHEAVGDFEKFMSDLMRVVRAAENNALASDPNQMVQDFYELCQRHVPALFKFIHQVYVHDNGLFDEIMKWISGIMDFLRNGNGKKIDLNKMCQQGEAQAGIDIAKVQRELDSIVSWIDARRKWREKQRAHKKSKNDNTQAIKEWQDALPTNGLDGTAFGLDENDLEEVDDDDDESDLEDEDADADTDSGLTAVEQEQRRRARLLQRLEQQAHAPVRPEITELPKLREFFHLELSNVLRPAQDEQGGVHPGI